MREHPVLHLLLPCAVLLDGDPEVLSSAKSRAKEAGGERAKVGQSARSGPRILGPRSIRLDAPLPREEGCLDAVAHLELLQDIGHVVLDGFFLQIELAPDLLVAQPLGEEP